MKIHPDDQQRGWFKSSFSTGSCSCVEASFDADKILLRDSKYLRNPKNDPATQPTITVTLNDWLAFLDEVVGDKPSETAALTIEHAADGTTTIRSATAQAALVYTPDEWTAFVNGTKAGEFHPHLAPL